MEIILKQNRAYPDEYYLAIKGSNDFLLRMELMGELKGEHETAVKLLSTMSDALKKGMQLETDNSRAENDTPDVDCQKFINHRARRATKDIIESLGMKWRYVATPLDK